MESVPDGETIVEMWKIECPTMVKMLEREGILEAYAEQLVDQALALANRTPGEYSEALNRALMETIPSSPEQEAEWIAINQADPFVQMETQRGCIEGPGRPNYWINDPEGILGSSGIMARSQRNR